MSHTRKYALIGEKPHRLIDLALVMLSKGTLPGVAGAEAVLVGNVLTVNWSAEADQDQYVHPRDQVVIIAYIAGQADKGARVCYNNCGADRCGGQGMLSLPSNLTGRPMDVYLFVASCYEQILTN